MPGRFLRELTIRQLRALTAVQKHRSVTAAAKQLHLTQPAVTLQLRNLQELAGLPLIQRTGDGMLLTDAGRKQTRFSRTAKDYFSGGGSRDRQGGINSSHRRRHRCLVRADERVSRSLPWVRGRN